MKKTSLIFRLLFCTLLIALLAACSNILSLADKEEEKALNTKASPETSRRVEVTGYLSLGALPSTFIEESQESTPQNLRTAGPTLPASLQYSLTATSASGEVITVSFAPSENGQIQEDSGSIRYNIKLSEGNWTLLAKAEKEGSAVLSSSPVSVSILGGVSKSQNLRMTYYPVTPGGSGRVSLKVKASDDVIGIDLSKTHFVFDGSYSGSYDDSTNVYTVEDVAQGSYSLSIYFKDSENKNVVTIFEQVNVYGGCTTDYFFKNGGGDFSYINDSGEILLTKAFVEKATYFEDIYVKSDGNDDNAGTYFSPVETLDRAIEIANQKTLNEGKTPRIIVRDNIYLNQDTTITKNVSIQSETDAPCTVLGNLHTITVQSNDVTIENLNFTSPGRMTIEANSKLTINNSRVENITSSSTGTSSYGGAFFVKANGNLTSTAGLVIKDIHREGFSGGGIYVVSDGKASLTGTLIESCSTGTGESGGGIYAAGEVELTGVTIKNCSTEGSGGGIYDNGKVTLKGSSIEGCTSALGKGNAVYLAKATTGAEKTLEIGSGVRISSDVYLAKSTTSTALSKITIIDTIENEIQITPESYTQDTLVLEATPPATLSANYTKFKVTDESDGTTWEVDNEGKLKSNAEPEASTKDLYVKEDGSDDNTGVNFDNAFKTLSKALSVIESSGDAAKDFTIHIQGTLSEEGKTLGSGLNGKAESITLKGDTAATFKSPNEDTAESILKVETTVPVTIKAITIDGDNSYLDVEGRGLHLGANAKVTLSSSTKIVDCSTQGDDSAGGGGAYVSSSATLTIEDGAEISNCLSYTDGGGVYVAADGTLSIKGGSIKENSALNDQSEGGGGGIFIAQGATLLMEGGTVGGSNTADKNEAKDGAGIYLAGEATISSGSIEGNEASASYGGRGGGIFVSSTGKLTLIGSASIKANKAVSSSSTTNGGSGGGIYVDGGSSLTERLKMEGGIVGGSVASDANQAVYGAGIYINGNAKATVTGGSIEGNTATTADAQGGGIYVYASAVLDLNGGSVSKNTATKQGGGVYVDEGIFNFTSGNVSENSVTSTTTGSGGGIYVYGEANTNNFTMGSGALLSKNSAKKSGGGIYFGSFVKKDFTIGGTIEENTSDGDGGGIYANQACTLTLSSVTLSKNKAGTDYGKGGGIYLGGSNAKVLLLDCTVENNTAAFGGAAHSGSTNGASLSIKGSTSIPYGGGTVKNDVYLPRGSNIAIEDNLTAQIPVVTITAGSPTVGTRVLSNNTNLSANYFKFALTNTGFFIQSDGTLSSSIESDATSASSTITNSTGLTLSLKITDSSLTQDEIKNIVSAINNSSLSSISLDFSGASIQGSTTWPQITLSGEAACTKLESIILPEGITEIQASAFLNCTGLKTVVLPSSLNTIGAGSFASCTSLSNVYFGDPDATWKGTLGALSTSFPASEPAQAASALKNTAYTLYSWSKQP